MAKGPFKFGLDGLGGRYKLPGRRDASTVLRGDGTFGSASDPRLNGLGSKTLLGADGPGGVQQIVVGAGLEIADGFLNVTGGGSAHVIEDEGAPVTQRADLNFTGAGVSVADAGGKTVVTIPGASALNIKQAEIDFGTTPVEEAEFVVADGDVSAGSQIVGSVAYEAPTGKDLDELEMDALDLKFAPGAGQLTIRAKGLEGYLADKFKVNYLVG